MKTYKIGNKVKCIIRSYSSGYIGETRMEYDNQPYTVLQDIEASMSFKNIRKDSSDDLRQMSFNVESISEIRLSNISLTSQILNLIFLKNEDKLCNTCENYDSNTNKIIYLHFPADEVYQMFVYNNNGELEAAYGTYSEDTLEVEEANSNYLIFYSYKGEKGYSLNKQNNFYVTLDLEVIGNTDDNTTKTWIHFDKCAITVDKNMYFNSSINTIDLTFKILDSGNDYITLS